MRDVLHNGVLRKCEKNPRYFTDASGEAIYLTGAHTWEVFQDAVDEDGNLVRSFDYEGYLRELQEYGYNFLRFWNRENAVGMGREQGKTIFTYPMAYERVGTRENGYPVFDLTRLNEAYFQRMRERVIQAGEKGIYVSVMLFEGWSVDTRGKDVWEGHPYCRENNVNGIDGRPEREVGTALSGENDVNPFCPTEHIIVHSLENPEITGLQKAYVKKILETLNDLDNVMYEIANEAFRWSRYWQYEMIDFIHETEKTMPKQHPVWMSHVVQAQNESLWISNAEAISPGVESTQEDYCINPPAGNGQKVILADTDHLGGIWGSRVWAWKSFLRGLNPIFMDDRGLDNTAADNGVSLLFGRFQYGLPGDWQVPVRRALGQTAAWAEKINLTQMVPAEWVSSTKYCLAQLGEEYLVYQPESGQFKMNLHGANREFSVEWYRPEADELIPGEPFVGGMAIDFTPPCTGEVLLHLKATK